MKDFTIAIYCFIDDILKKISNDCQHFNRKLSDSQVITTLIVSAKYFYGNHHSACSYMRSHYGFKPFDKSNFNRRVHKLSDLICELFSNLGLMFKHLNIESVYLIDSFPVAVCKNIRICRSQLLKGEEYRGYNASKREWFYGFKVHVITTADGVPVEFYVSPGSTHDAKAFKVMDIFLPEKSTLYGDNAYDSKEQAELLFECQGIILRATKRKNAKEADTYAEELEKKYFRKRIENTFADINAKFPKKIHAVTAAGFLIKILIFIILSSIETFI